MLIDHLIYAAPDLEIAVADIERRFGVRPSGGGKHTGQGTHNKLLSLGRRTYLEIVAPDPEEPEPRSQPPYGVDGVSGGGLVGWALACENIEATREHARVEGFDPGEVMDGHRVTPTGTLLRWRLTSNALTAGLIPFLITWGDTPHPASSAPPGLVLTSLHIAHPDPSSIIGPLTALGAEVEVHPASDAALVAKLTGPRGSGELR